MQVRGHSLSIARRTTRELCSPTGPSPICTSIAAMLQCGKHNNRSDDVWHSVPSINSVLTLSGDCQGSYSFGSPKYTSVSTNRYLPLGHDGVFVVLELFHVRHVLHPPAQTAHSLRLHLAPSRPDRSNRDLDKGTRGEVVRAVDHPISHLWAQALRGWGSADTYTESHYIHKWGSMKNQTSETPILIPHRAFLNPTTPLAGCEAR